MPAVVARDDIAGLCAQLAAILDDDREVSSVVYDLSAVVGPNVVTVEALARLQLTARRAGCGVRVQGAGVALRELLTLTGLDAVLHPPPKPGD
nr:STAS domain-containing protein [Micromonospora sp. DSM 115978]